MFAVSWFEQMKESFFVINNFWVQLHSPVVSEENPKEVVTLQQYKGYTGAENAKENFKTVIELLGGQQKKL